MGNPCDATDSMTSFTLIPPYVQILSEIEDFGMGKRILWRMWFQKIKGLDRRVTLDGFN